ncbi:MAG: hypothetical protein CMI02_11115 [Oceanospirillaceae bacterium]|nr:hypothetical protein [Oceanospirillaceae bacterium]MBT12570.1 hypothetical protein [Oceanospirillaceae bacterium]|tara:strand:+ start:60 stop:644 length:585 start_codon:yes stop_codon:yes gene_type:complete
MNKFSAALLSATAVLAMAPAANAGGSLDISLSDDVARLGYDATQMGSGLHVSLAGLYDDDKGEMLSAGLHVVDVRPSTSNLYIGVGAKLFAYSTDRSDRYDDYSGLALGVGGFFRYSFASAPDVSLAGHAYYAPPVISFADTDNMIVSDLRLQFSLLPTARVYAGYRYNGIRLEDVDNRYKLGDGAHLGLTIDF